MPVAAFLWQSAKGVVNVRLYRHRCVETIRICRSLRNKAAGRPDNNRVQLLLEVASTALDRAIREDPETEDAFDVFLRAVNELNIKDTDYYVENRMELAKVRDEQGAEKHKSILAKLSDHNTERHVLSHGGPSHSSLFTFIVAPCKHTVSIDRGSLTSLNFHVDHESTLPELVFRFHRKHRQRLSSQQHLRFPHFYTKREIDLAEDEDRVIRPLDNTNMTTLASEDTIWVYGDNPHGHYELVQGSGSGLRRNRIRSVSFAPARGGLERVYRDICGYLALERFLFRPVTVFPPWVETDATLLGFRPSAYIREDPWRPGKAVIEDSHRTSLADAAIAGIVAQEVVNRALELETSSSPAQNPYDGYISETMFALQRRMDESTMPGALPIGPDEAALLAINPLTTLDWWGWRPRLASLVAPVTRRSRFPVWGRS